MLKGTDLRIFSCRNILEQRVSQLFTTVKTTMAIETIRSLNFIIIMERLPGLECGPSKFDVGILGYSVTLLIGGGAFGRIIWVLKVQPIEGMNVWW